MKRMGGMAVAGGTSLVALSLLLAPALAATQQQPQQSAKKPRPVVSLRTGSFTPAVADPRLAAEFARRGLPAGGFRFTPTAVSRDKSKAVKVDLSEKRSRTDGPGGKGGPRGPRTEKPAEPAAAPPATPPTT